MYKDGKPAGHEGAWTANTAGAKAGLFMPSRPLLGARFYQEIAPGVNKPVIHAPAIHSHASDGPPDSARPLACLARASLYLV